MTPVKVEQDDWFSFASFLASSARAGLEESVIVSGHRFMEAVRRLVGLVPELRDQPFFSEIETRLEESLTDSYLKSPEDFTQFLDELLQRFALEARKRNQLD